MLGDHFSAGGGCRTGHYFGCISQEHSTLHCWSLCVSHSCRAGAQWLQVLWMIFWVLRSRSHSEDSLEGRWGVLPCAGRSCARPCCAQGRLWCCRAGQWSSPWHSLQQHSLWDLLLPYCGANLFCSEHRPPGHRELLPSTSDRLNVFSY